MKIISKILVLLMIITTLSIFTLNFNMVKATAITKVDFEYTGIMENDYTTTEDLTAYVNSKKAAFQSSLSAYNGATIGSYDSFFTTDDNNYTYAVLGTAGNIVDGTITIPYTTYMVTKVDGIISSIDVNVTAPSVGTVIGETTAPIITTGSNCNASDKAYIVSYPTDEVKFFTGTIEADKYYYAEMYVVPKQGSIFANNKDSLTVNLSGAVEYKFGYYSANGFMLFVKMKAGGTSSVETSAANSATTEYKVLNGENQKVSRNANATFRFNIEYAKFLASGKVFVDGKQVDSKNFTSKEGSTIITFNKSFINTLSVGKHTVKVTVDDGEVATDFTVTKNPATGDNIVIYVSMAIMSVVGLGGIVAYRKLRK